MQPRANPRAGRLRPPAARKDAALQDSASELARVLGRARGRRRRVAGLREGRVRGLLPLRHLGPRFLARPLQGLRAQSRRRLRVQAARILSQLSRSQNGRYRSFLRGPSLSAGPGAAVRADRSPRPSFSHGLLAQADQRRAPLLHRRHHQRPAPQGQETQASRRPCDRHSDRDSALRNDCDGNPGRVPKPSRDASLPAKPAGSARAGSMFIFTRSP